MNRPEVRRFLAEASPAEVRRLMDTADGYDPEVWCAIARDLGWLQLGWPEVAVVLEEMGRVLLCAPFFSTAILARAAIGASGDKAARDRFLAPMADGRLVATVAIAEPGGEWDPAHIATSATPAGPGRYVLEGQKAFVLDGHLAEVIVVAARSAEGLGLFLVDADAPPGLTRTAVPTMDQTRRLADLDLDATPARLLGRAGTGDGPLRRVLDVASVALAAEAVGGAQRCLDLAVEHATNRHQFGRPIGSFQAVQHTCAAMLVAVESARATAGHAAAIAGASTGGVPPALEGRSGPAPPALEGRSGPGDDLTVAASLAKICCSEGYYRVAADTIQVHGASGFSWDHDAHLYFKRATSSRLLFGDPLHHRRLLAQRLAF